MIILPLEFKDGSGGYSAAPLTYKQVARKGNIAVYQRFYDDGKPKDFETIVVKILPKGTKIFDKITEDDEEKYPGTATWGRLAWSFGNQSAAVSKMEEMVKGDTFGEKEKVPELDVVVDGVKYFTVTQFATNNNVPYINAANMIKELLEKGSVKLIGEKHLNPKGKASKIYTKTS
jgi:hypothetical protein